MKSTTKRKPKATEKTPIPPGPWSIRPPQESGADAIFITSPTMDRIASTKSPAVAQAIVALPDLVAAAKLAIAALLTIPCLDGTDETIAALAEAVAKAEVASPPRLEPHVERHIRNGREQFKAYVEDPASGKVYRQGWFDRESDAHTANVERMKLLRGAAASG